MLGGENIHNYFIKSIASSHYFIKSIASSRCVEDTLGSTLVHTLVHDKYSPLVGCLENSDRKAKQFRVIPRIAPSRLLYRVWFCNVTSDLYRETVTQETLR